MIRSELNEKELWSRRKNFVRVKLRTDIIVKKSWISDELGQDV